jgi:hypothetical protein
MKQPMQIPTDSYTYDTLEADITIFINNISQVNNAVFLVASRFNLLEGSPDDLITGYIWSSAQGQRVALSSPAGTLFRKYFIYYGEPQKSNKQINTLQEVIKKLESTSCVDRKIIQDNGWIKLVLRNGDISTKDIAKQSLQKICDNHLKVGIHWNTPLLVNSKLKVCQVYASTFNISTYDKTEKNNIKNLTIAILTSTYKCTLQAGVNKLSTEKPRATIYLTAIGGGVFDTPKEWIKEALINAILEYRYYPLDIIMIDNKSPSEQLSKITINQIVESHQV